MGKFIVLSVVTALLCFVGTSFTPSYAQTPASANTPTFYHLVPGTYVNGWPRFTVHYPKEWVELPHLVLNTFFVAGAPGPTTYPQVRIGVGPGLPLDTVKDFMARRFGAIATDVTVVSDKPSHLGDGAPAREFEFTYKVNGVPENCVFLTTNKGDETILVDVVTRNGMIGEDLKAYLYSLEFQPGFDEPVKLPPDVQAFIDTHDNAYLSHDVEKVMAHYSDGFLNSGVRKGEMAKFVGQGIGFVTSIQGHITEFVPAGDRAYLTGFVVVNGQKYMIQEISIIKENGEWRWYGNQRDVVP